MEPGLGGGEDEDGGAVVEGADDLVAAASEERREAGHAIRGVAVDDGDVGVGGEVGGLLGGLAHGVEGGAEVQDDGGVVREVGGVEDRVVVQVAVSHPVADG